MTVTFESVLADYLALRRRLGHKLADAERVLGRFVVYLEDYGVETVTLDTALTFILDPDLDPASTNPSRRLQAVRGFTRYLAGIDPATEVPPAGIVSYRASRRQPYLFTDDEITVLMATAAGSARTAQRAVMLQTLIGLLAVTGMRVGEALRLTDADVERDNVVVTIRATKFNKSRQVPVTPSTLDALGSCTKVRDETFPSSVCPRVFVSRAGTPFAYSDFCLNFRRVVDTAGIGASHPTRPRIHDLRHGFAIRTLVGWHRAGSDVAAMLPRLSTYLGHREPRYTYRYLTATPELLGHAAMLLEADQAASR
ncbi:MAG TPA: tyrosine-type recombinase/integrase [Acidimicrobiales bacterium]|nr:tyrosine-type recombinase/integrase [Acidimicrobiales bacterium]